MNSIDENGFDINVESAMWREHLSERELKELEFAEVYAREFFHGTDGHNRLLLIARMAKMMDYITYIAVGK